MRETSEEIVSKRKERKKERERERERERGKRESSYTSYVPLLPAPRLDPADAGVLG